MRKLLALLVALPALASSQTPPGVAPYPGAPVRPPRPAPRGGTNLPPGAPPVAPATTPPAPPPPAPAAPAPGRPAQRGTAATVPAGDQAGHAGGDAAASGPCRPLEGKFLLAFNKADIVDVLEQASRWTCRNFAYTEDVARGKITLLSKTPVTADEAYAAFLAALTANNIAIYPSGKYYKLVRIADAKKAPIPTLLQDGSEAPALEQPVTKIFRLHSADADQLRGVLGNFTSPQGADIQVVPPDTLIVTDIGLNVRRIERMIDAFDRPGAGELIRFIQVKYASARDIAEKVNQIFQSGPAAAGQPARGGRRPVIGGVAAPGQPPGAPGPAPAPTASGGGDADLQVSKVLPDERTNKLLVIADEKGFQRIKELVEQLDVPTAGEGQIHVVFMKNASAEDLAQTLQALAQGTTARRQGATGGGAAPGQNFTPPTPQPTPAAPGGATTANLFSGEVKVTADKVANALIVMAGGADWGTIQRLVDKLDQPRRQVFVEAAIIEVNLQDENQFGVSMHGLIPVKTADGTGYIPLGSQTGRLNSLNPLSSLTSLGGFLTGAVGPTSASLSDVAPNVPSVSVLIQALQTNSDVNVISTPHLLATDNEDAEITVGQNVPFQAGYNAGLASTAASATGTSSSAVSSLIGNSLLNNIAPIQRQNVELRLRIKPQITEGDNIRLTIDEQTEEIASKDPQLGPTTAKRTIKTNISVKDQSTIVIGGLIQERAIQAVHKTPLLGDIPVLGWLFRDSVTTKTKTNLLLFLTPYIIHDPSDYRRIYERKRREQQEFMEQFYGTQSKYEPVVDYARKAGPYARVRHDVQVETLRLENGGPGAPGEGVVKPPGAPQGAAPAAPAGPGAAPPSERPVPPNEMPVPPPPAVENAPPAGPVTPPAPDGAGPDGPSAPGEQ